MDASLKALLSGDYQTFCFAPLLNDPPVRLTTVPKDSIHLEPRLSFPASAEAPGVTPPIGPYISETPPRGGSPANRPSRSSAYGFALPLPFFVPPTPSPTSFTGPDDQWQEMNFGGAQQQPKNQAQGDEGPTRATSTPYGIPGLQVIPIQVKIVPKGRQKHCALGR
jgi:hypothetical protein